MIGSRSWYWSGVPDSARSTRRARTVGGRCSRAGLADQPSPSPLHTVAAVSGPSPEVSKLASAHGGPKFLLWLGASWQRASRGPWLWAEELRPGPEQGPHTRAAQETLARPLPPCRRGGLSQGAASGPCSHSAGHVRRRRSHQPDRTVTGRGPGAVAAMTLWEVSVRCSPTRISTPTSTCAHSCTPTHAWAHASPCTRECP